MNKIKKLLFALSLPFFFAAPVMAGGVNVFDQSCAGASGSTICDNRNTGGIFESGGLLRNGLQVFILVVGFASILMVAVGGFKYVVSRGDPQATASARQTIIYAIVGLVIALGSQGILTFVIDRV